MINLVLVVIIVLLALVSIWCWSVTRKESQSVFGERLPIPVASYDPSHRPHFAYSGIVNGRMPARMYEGDSFIVTLTISPIALGRISPPAKYRRIDTLGFESHHEIPQLEAELLIVGFDISDEHTQTKPLYNDRVTSFYWNISPPKSGTFEIGFVFRTETVSYPDLDGDVMREVGTFNSKVIVTKYDGLTNNQVNLMKGASALVATILAIVQILSMIGVISLH